MTSDKPPIVIDIKPKVRDCDSNTNVSLKDSEKNVGESDNQNSQRNIHKTVRFSCPQERNDTNNRNNSANINRQNHDTFLTEHRVNICQTCSGDSARRKIRNILHSNLSKVRKKVRLQLRKNIRNQFRNNRSNGVTKYEREITAKFKPGQKLRRQVQKRSEHYTRKSSPDRQRRKNRDQISEKEREINTKKTRDASFSRERVRQMPTDKTCRNFNQRYFKYDTQKKLQGYLGKKSQLRKNYGDRKNFRQFLPKNVQSKVFTGKTFNSNNSNLSKHHETSEYQYTRYDEYQNPSNLKQKYSRTHQIEDSFNSQETVVPTFQKSFGDTGEECAGCETHKIIRGTKKGIWDVDHRRNNIEKIASEIRDDIAKTLCSSNQKSDGNFPETDINVCIQGATRDTIQKDTRNDINPIDGKFIQRDMLFNSPTKSRECQRNVRDNRRRNAYMRSEVYPTAREHYAESINTQHSQKSSQDNISIQSRNTRENSRRRRTAGYAPIRNVSQKDIRNTVHKRIGNFEKKIQIGKQKSVRSFRNTSSESGRNKFDEWRGSTNKRFLDVSQKNFRVWKNEKNDREVFRKNDISCATKNNMEEKRPRISHINDKNELGLPHKKGCRELGKSGRDSNSKTSGDLRKTISDGNENSFWDFYRTNVWEYSRKIPRDESWIGSHRADIRGGTRKSTRASSQKSARNNIRKNGYVFSQKDFGTGEKKTIAYDSYENTNGDSYSCVNSGIRENVSADSKKNLSSDNKKNISYEGCKSFINSRKNFCFSPRKNIWDPSPKILRDLPPRNVYSDLQKNIRSEPGENTRSLSTKSTFDCPCKHIRSISSQASRCTSPQARSDIHESRLRSGSPKTFWDRAWRNVRSCSPKSNDIYSPEVGHHSCASFGENSSKSRTSRMQSPVNKSKVPGTSSSKTSKQRLHSGHVIGNFPWPAQNMYRSNDVRNNAPWNVLGESKSNARIYPIFCHPADRHDEDDVYRKDQYHPIRRSKDDTRPMVRSSKKLLGGGLCSFESYRSSAGNECGKHIENYPQPKDNHDVARTASAKVVHSSQENTNYNMGKHVGHSGKSRQFQKNAWASYPWVVRSTWGINESQLKDETRRCSPEMWKTASKYSTRNVSSSGHLASNSTDKATME